MSRRGNERGFALLAVMMLAALLTTILAGYFLLTNAQRSTTRFSMESSRGFYAAEAGLNLRFDAIRDVFRDYGLPAGASPPEVAGQLPCRGADTGSGDYACQTFALDGRGATTYVTGDPRNPMTLVIPRGELYQNLRAIEHGYDISSVALNSAEQIEAILDARVRVRLVPIFQFAAFYNKDLEILPGPAMTLQGPVHSNGDLYLGAATGLTIDGQVTAAGKLYTGRKEQDSGSAADVLVHNPVSPQALPRGANRREVTEGEQTPWHGMIRTGVDMADVPPPEALDPTPGETYWDGADLRIMLDLNGATPTVELRDPTGGADAANTAILNGCSGAVGSGAVGSSVSFYNHREGAWIQMLEVDVEAVLDCVQANGAMMDGKGLDDATHGGLVWYLGVDGPDSDSVNDYGVRVINGAELTSSDATAPEVRGLTIVTHQALYVQGDFNAVDKKPAAFLTDSLNVLSNAWDDTNSLGPLSGAGARIASSTTINAAFLAGTDSTGDVEGTGGQDAGHYNGGLENYPRFHEDWSGQTLTYRGSFVSLDTPRHVDGRWEDQSYNPPDRDWGYDLDFNDPANLPPLAPRFLYVKQELFVRQFEL